MLVRWLGGAGGGVVTSVMGGSKSIPIVCKLRMPCPNGSSSRRIVCCYEIAYLQAV